MQVRLEPNQAEGLLDRTLRFGPNPIKTIMSKLDRFAEKGRKCSPLQNGIGSQKSFIGLAPGTVFTTLISFVTYERLQLTRVLH